LRIQCYANRVGDIGAFRRRQQQIQPFAAQPAPSAQYHIAVVKIFGHRIGAEVFDNQAGRVTGSKKPGIEFDAGLSFRTGYGNRNQAKRNANRIPVPYLNRARPSRSITHLWNLTAAAAGSLTVFWRCQYPHYWIFLRSWAF